MPEEKDRKVAGYWSFMCDRYLWPMRIVVVLFICFGVWLFYGIDAADREKDLGSLSFWMSAVVAFSTFTFTLFSTIKDWQKTFTKYMNVVFWLGDKKVLEIKSAPLAGEADIRAYAQQIGMQANSPDLKQNQRWLALSPKFYFNSKLQPKSCKIEYSVDIYLRSAPERLTEFEKEKGKEGYLFWDVRDTDDMKFKPVN